MRILAIMGCVPLFWAGMLHAEATMIWKTDSVISAWTKLLPAGWSIAPDGSNLVVSSGKPVFLLKENKINAPLSRETAAERAARIRKFGKPVHPKLVFALSPRFFIPRRFLSANCTVELVETIGIDDEMNSVDDPSVSAEVRKLLNSLQSTLYLAVTDASELESMGAGTLVIAVCRKAALMNQGRLNYPAGYPYSEYIEIGTTQTVAYSKKPLPGKGPWEITGRVLVLEPEEPDPSRKDTIREAHLVAEEVR